jgi:tetratricopeptide (TPR) repeat protein
MITKVYEFLTENFGKMPKIVQIITYLVFLSVFVSLLYGPRYIDVRLLSTIEEDEFPLGGARIDIESGDRVLRMYTNQDGRFSVPITWANPIGSYRFILYPEPGNNRLKEVSVSGTKAFKTWPKLIYSRAKDSYEFRSAGSFSLFSSAYAQNVGFLNQDDIGGVIVQSISKSSGIDVSDIHLSSKLTSDLSLTNYDISYINFNLKKSFNIDSWDKLTKNAETVEDVIAISRSLYYQDKPWGEHLISRFKDTNRLLSEAREKYPNEIFETFSEARTLRKAGQISKSLKLLSSVLAEHPNFYLAKYNQALAYQAEGHLKDADQAFLETIRIQENSGFLDASIYNTYGRFLFENGRSKAAINKFKKVKSINPNRDYVDEYINDVLKILNCENLETCTDLTNN